MAPAITLLTLALLTACGGSTTTAAMASSANIESEKHCEAGFGDACVLLGMSRWLHAEAEDEHPNASLQPFSSACELGEWLGCAMAGSVQAGTGGDAQESATKAYDLARTACEADSDASACAFIGDWAAKANEIEVAKTHYARACGLAMTPDTRGQVIGEFICKRAIKFGTAKADLLPLGSNLNPLEEATRVSGDAQIHPPDSDARTMHRTRVGKEGAQLLLCLSKAGVPRKIFFTVFSNFPRWNRKIFETMRTWRYSPMISAEGKKVPVCKSVTFFYLPSA